MTVLANLARLHNSYRTTTGGARVDGRWSSSDGAWNWLDLDSISALDNNRYLLSPRVKPPLLLLWM